MKTRLRPNHKLTYCTFFILWVALAGLLWTIFGSKSWLVETIDLRKEAIYLSVSFVVMVIGMIIYISKIYYVIEDEQIVRHGSKIMMYRFNNIVYLDEKYSKKHVDLKFYSNSGYWVYLTDTRQHDLYKIIKQKSPLLDYDAFRAKYPKAPVD
ncbi:MAG: hypothetical protein MJ207_02705 [Bacilli bacterium]|nr:hypothetical protein [Bacilli bacterium]MCQ2794253.1 hypothetical protein [Bacilli bacterium]